MKQSQKTKRQNILVNIAGVILIAAQVAAGAKQLPMLASPQFEEPLVATTPTSAAEDAALRHAILSYGRQSNTDDFREFDAFLSDYPRSGWRAALLTNLGLSYYHYGYFSKAIDTWERAWQAGRAITEPRAKALVDRAVGELARMHARLGHAERLEACSRRSAAGRLRVRLLKPCRGPWKACG